MKFEELNKEGLSREYKISIPVKTVEENVEKALLEKQKTFKMPGFREGSVPLSMVKQKFQAELWQSEVRAIVSTALNNLFEENKISPVSQPQIEQGNSGNSGEPATELVFTAKFDVKPEIPEVDWSKLEVENIKIKITDEDIKKAHNDLLQNYKNYEDAPKSHKSAEGDQVVVDFEGKLDGEVFEGGKGQDVAIVLGAKQFLPDFEKELYGRKANDSYTFNMKFPEDYPKKELAGKEVEFSVTIKAVKLAKEQEDITDEFAQKLGAKDKDNLNEMIKSRLESELNSLTRLRTKKVLFDKIDQEHDFMIPQSMVNADLNSMEQEIKRQAEQERADEEKIRSEYKKIAERRVRLGLILSEVANRNNLKVTEQDIQQAIQNAAMQRPGQEKQVVEFYSKPENMQYLTGPIIEEKAVDFILGQVKKADIEVTSKEFMDKYAKDIQAAS